MKEVPVSLCPFPVCLGLPCTRPVLGLRTERFPTAHLEAFLDLLLHIGFPRSYQADKRCEEGPADFPPNARLVANHFFNVPVKPVHTYKKKWVLKIKTISVPRPSSLLMVEHRPGTARGWQCGMGSISWRGWGSGTQIHANSFHVPGVLLRAQREGPWASASLCWGLCEGLEK